MLASLNAMFRLVPIVPFTGAEKKIFSVHSTEVTEVKFTTLQDG